MLTNAGNNRRLTFGLPAQFLDNILRLDNIRQIIIFERMLCFVLSKPAEPFRPFGIFDLADKLCQDILCIAEARSFKELPKNAQKYLKRISELTETEIGIISVGPNRDQTFYI